MSDSNISNNTKEIYTELRKDLVEFSEEEILPLIKDENNLSKAKEKAFLIALKIFMIHDSRLQNVLTLQEVAIILGISRARVKQIEDNAQGKLKHPKFSRGLRNYLQLGTEMETSNF
jgi:DNA-directed RNA polymerase specialized sigma subunit